MADGARPGETAWDAFYGDWVAPVVHVATPALVVFVVLLVAMRLVTRVVVRPDAVVAPVGPRFPYQPWTFAYWLAVVGLAVAAADLTVGIAVARGEHLHRAARALTWTGAVFAVAVSVVLLFVVLRSSRMAGAAEPATATGAAAALAAIVVAAISVAVPNGSAAPAIAGGVLAVVGAIVAARARGLTLGLVIDGADDLAGSVRARLHALGSAQPAGIQVTQATDVSSLPDDAITLLPDGTLRKAITLLVNLVTPATPWRVTLTEPDDGSVIVVLQRNGRTVDSTVVRRARLGLLPLPAGTTLTTADRAPLRTGAAAYVLLTLADRHPQLRVGLCGATSWRSVAQQVVAVDPSTKDAVPLLTSAVALDARNATARNGLLVSKFVNATKPDELREFVAGLRQLASELPDGDGWQALRLRVLFNLVAANLNLVRVLDRSHADAALDQARAAVNELTEQLRTGADSAELGDLRDEITPTAWILDAIVDREIDPNATVADVEPSSLLGYYERACLHLLTDDVDRALADLEFAATYPRLRAYARDDVWLNELHDSPQFKKIVGDPLPAKFLDLGLFDDVRTALQQRGVRSLGHFRKLTASWLHAELGASQALGDHWREVAELATIVDPEEAGALHLLVGIGVETRDDLRGRLAEPAKFRTDLVTAARPYAIVAPSDAELARWTRALA